MLNRSNQSRGYSHASSPVLFAGRLLDGGAYRAGGDRRTLRPRAGFLARPARRRRDDESGLDGAESEGARAGAFRRARPDRRFGQSADGIARDPVLSGANASGRAAAAG